MGKINGEDGELVSGIRVRGCRCLPPNAVVADLVGTTEARRSFDQYGADTAKDVTSMAQTPPARAMATERLRRAVGGNA